MTGSVLGYGVWGLCGAAGVALWVLARARPDLVVRPSEVVARLVTVRVVRVALLVGYLFLGWHLFAR
jgi:Family of unknown function (DUF6186)